MRDWDWKRADMSRKNLAGPTRFLLFNLISVLEEELNFRFSVLCFASQSTKKEKDGKSGKEKKTCSLVSWIFFLQCSTFYALFFLIIFDLCNCFYYFHIVPERRCGWAVSAAATPPAPTLIAEITRVFPHISIFFSFTNHSHHFCVRCVPKTGIPWLKSLRQ